VKIALAQINPTVGDFSGNAKKIIEYSRRAQTAGAGLVVFPEMSVCGYPARDWVERPAFVTKCREAVEHIAQITRGISVICGYASPAESETGKSVLNSAALLRDGKIDFVQSKMLLPTYDVFDESRNFAPARSSFCCRFAESRSLSPSAKTPGTTSSFGTAASTGLTRWSSSSKPAGTSC